MPNYWITIALLQVCLVAWLASSPAGAFLPFTNPPWPPTYDLRRSTIAMAWNTTSWTDPSFARHFGIVSFDWSNAKQLWANTKPMDCEGRLLTQARATKAAGWPRKLHDRIAVRVSDSSAASNGTDEWQPKVFVYRNLVKALPWFESVRRKIEDPRYSGFFLKFGKSSRLHVPPCTTQANITKCSSFYHDQEQTPQVPTLDDPNPDGACEVECDCGYALPCGEYLFDHRNGSMLTDWLVNEYILGPTGVGSDAIDGLFIDDFWCSSIINGSSACNDPVQGPSEIDANSQADMQLSDQDIADITNGWLHNMQVVQRAILDAKGYTWSLIPGQANANAMPIMVNETSCARWLSIACNDSTPFISAPLLSGLTTVNSTSNPFPYLQQQLAAFLLMRGPYAWIGFGEWGMKWPFELPFPDAIFNAPDYGVPLDQHCQRASGSIFVRKWSKATVQLDCATFQASITMT